MDSIVARHFSDAARIKLVRSKSRVRFYRVEDNGEPLFAKYFDFDGSYEQAEAEYSALRWYESNNRNPAYTVTPPRECIRVGSERGSVVTNYVKMARADHWLNVSARLPFLRRRILRQIAGWMANFHEMSTETVDGLDLETTIDPLIESLTGQARRHSRVIDDEKLLQLRTLSGELLPSGQIHGDLVAHNIFFSKEKVVVCDFGLSNKNFLYIDVSKFLVSLIWRSRFLYIRFNKRIFFGDVHLFHEYYKIEGEQIEFKTLSFFLLMSISV